MPIQGSVNWKERRCVLCLTEQPVCAGVRLDVDAERAEEQELEKGGLADTLREIVERTLPSPRYVRFHEAHVQRYLSRLKAFPPRCIPIAAMPLLSPADHASLQVLSSGSRFHNKGGGFLVQITACWSAARNEKRMEVLHECAYAIAVSGINPHAAPQSAMQSV